MERYLVQISLPGRNSFETIVFARDTQHAEVIARAQFPGARINYVTRASAQGK